MTDLGSSLQLALQGDSDSAESVDFSIKRAAGQLFWSARGDTVAVVAANLNSVDNCCLESGPSVALLAS